MQTRGKPQQHTPGVPVEVPPDGTPIQSVIVHVPEKPAESSSRDWSVWGIILLLCLMFSGGVSAYVAKWSTSDQSSKIQLLEKRIERRESQLTKMQQQVIRLETKVERLEKEQ